MIKIIIELLIAAIFVFILLYLIMLIRLDSGEEPEIADVIIVPSGSWDGDRPRKAASLLKAGYSRSQKVIVSPLDEGNIGFYRDTNIKREQIINDEKATSTYENALNTLTIMESKGYSSAIVTSSDYHIRRVRYIFDKVNREYGYDLTYVSAYHGKDEVSWYKASKEVFISAMIEPFKHIGYRLDLYHIINLD